MIVVPANASILAWSSPDTCRVPIHPAGQSYLCEVMEVGTYSHKHTHTELRSTKSILSSLSNIFWCNHCGRKSTLLLSIWQMSQSISITLSHMTAASWIIYHKDKAFSLTGLWWRCVSALRHDTVTHILMCSFHLSQKMDLGCRTTLVIACVKVWRFSVYL